MIKMRENVTPGETPAEITVSMIDQDLKDGISKPEMATKYGIKPWEVDEMFKHPFLKGRRPSRKKKLSFSFVDDMPSEFEEITVDGGELEITIEADPNQITLDQAIDEAIIVAEEVKDQMQQTQDAILDMLSPTEVVTDKEDLVENLTKLAETSDEFQATKTGDNEWEIETDDVVMHINKEEQEEELEMDDDTFEL